MENIKKITIISIIIMAILETTIFAAVGIVNAPSGLVLRSEASKTGSPIATVTDKEEVEIIEKSGEWYKVKYNGQEGYLFAEYIKINEEDFTIEEPKKEENNETNQTLQNAIKVYIMPLISSTPINTLEPGATYTVEKEITNWSYINTGTIQGWIRTNLINNQELQNVGEGQQVEEKPIELEQTTTEVQEQPKQEETVQENTESQEEQKTQVDNFTEQPSTKTEGYISVDYANVRKEAATTSEIVTTLTKGTKVTITSETTEWYKVEYIAIDDTKYEGYIFKELIE